MQSPGMRAWWKIGLKELNTIFHHLNQCTFWAYIIL